MLRLSVWVMKSSDDTCDTWAFNVSQAFARIFHRQSGRNLRARRVQIGCKRV